MESVTSDVIAIIAKRLQGRHANIQLDDRLEDLGIESIEAIEMIFDLEEKFDIRLPYNANNAQLEFATVGDVARAVQSLLAGKT